MKMQRGWCLWMTELKSAVTKIKSSGHVSIAIQVFKSVADRARRSDDDIPNGVKRFIEELVKKIVEDQMNVMRIK